jgi:S-adenosylmethionine hydrolase
LLPLPREEGDEFVGEILWIDRFGNCQTNVDPDLLVARGLQRGDAVELRFGTETRRARFVDAFAAAKPSEVVVLVDSYGLLTIALDQRSAAQELKLRTGTAITVAMEVRR